MKSVWWKWLLLFFALAILMSFTLKWLLDVTEIQILPTGRNSSGSQGRNVQIMEIIKNNNKSYDLLALDAKGWHAIWDTQLETFVEEDSPLILRMFRYDSLQIVFFKNPYMGTVDIQTPAHSYRLDLYTSAEYGSEAIDIPFDVAESSSWGMCVGAGVFIAAVLAALCCLLYHAPATRGMQIFLSILSAVFAAAAGGGLLLVLHIDFGTVLNIAFLITYIFAAVLILPNLRCGVLDFLRGWPLFTLAVISLFAAVSSVYPQLIQPDSSYHFGVYGTICFLDMFIYWFLFFQALVCEVERLLHHYNSSDTAAAASSGPGEPSADKETTIWMEK